MQKLSKQEKKELKILHNKETRKEKRKRSHLLKRQKRSTFLSSLSDEAREDFIKKEHEVQSLMIQETMRVSQEGIPLIFDFSYCELMTSVELGSLQSQISASVGFLRKQHPQYFSLFCSNVPSAMTEKLSRRGCQKWQVQVFEEDLAKIPPVQGKNLIYLSPEGEEPLVSIDSQAVYVIGGLVDRTIQSCQSFARGKALGVKIMRLPLQEHGTGLIKPERRVFNINTVVSFIHFLASGKSCEEAFLMSIPKRWTLIGS
jgi:Trm5-related predicted tRNA methylase